MTALPEWKWRMFVDGDIIVQGYKPAYPWHKNTMPWMCQLLEEEMLETLFARCATGKYLIKEFPDDDGEDHINMENLYSLYWENGEWKPIHRLATPEEIAQFEQLTAPIR